MGQLFSTMQDSKLLMQMLLIVVAIASAFLTEILGEILTNRIGEQNTSEDKSGAISIVLHAVVLLVIFVGEVFVVLWITSATFDTALKEESIGILLGRVVDYYSWSLLIPILASVIASVFLKRSKKKRSTGLLILLLMLTIISGSVEFFLETFRLMERPNLPFPAEAVSAIVNSHFQSYPFALSRDELERIGDGSGLLSEGIVDRPISGTIDEPAINTPAEVYEEPDSLTGYISAIFAGTYAPGMGRLDYLHKAYEYYRDGRYTRSDHHYIGVMWSWIQENLYDFGETGMTSVQCLEEALNNYRKAAQYGDESAALYYNMALVCNILNDREEVRRCLKYASETWAEDKDPLNLYISYILQWLTNEPRTSLMDDASAVLGYKDDLSMYILYGACAVADNANVDRAYDALCSADEHYQGKSAMVKILRCICADLLGRDESWLLSEIYELEEKDSLTSTEELYLTRYFFVTNRYDELWGYIVDAGSDNGPSLDAELAAMKASWYFKNQTSTYFSMEAVKQLLDWVEISLAGVADGSEERELLLLSRALLQSCVGEIDGLDVDPDGLTGVSDLEYALIATRAFNAGKYQEALQACDQFFSLSREGSSPLGDEKVFQAQLGPQEQVVLRYFVQLVSARSHFEYAKPLWKGSDDWKEHMEAAERECAAFQQSSKSLFHIGEQFKILQNSIDIANGRIPADSDEPIEVFSE